MFPQPSREPDEDTIPLLCPCCGWPHVTASPPAMWTLPPIQWRCFFKIFQEDDPLSFLAVDGPMYCISPSPDGDIYNTIIDNGMNADAQQEDKIPTFSLELK